MDRNPNPHPSPLRSAWGRARGLLLAAAAACALLAGAPADANAGRLERIRLDMAKPQTKSERARTARHTKSSPQRTTATATAETVRLEGTLRVARDGSVRLGDAVVLMSRQALSLPDASGRLLSLTIQTQMVLA